MNSLSPAKRALLERKLRDKEAQQLKAPLRPGSAGKKPPLSFAQQRLWFLDQWQPRSAAYNISVVKRLRGPLNVDALDLALTEIVRRHETLRTTFAADGAAAVQVIHPPKPFCVYRIDLTKVPLEGKDAEVSRMIEEEASQPFNLVSGPLFRATLFRLEPEHNLLQLTVHHIVSDGWSMRVFQQELSRLYGAFLNGQSLPVSELPIQYADFAVWQRHSLQEDILAGQLCYWRKQLSDVATLDLPTDRPRPSMQTFVGASVELHVPRSVIERLKPLIRQEHATLFMTLLAAFQTLLHRYTAQDDIVVGTPIAGRTRVEIEPLIGVFVNMLVLRADTSGDPTFRELLRRVAKAALDAYAHQDVPFERLVEELQPRRDPSRNPLFQVLFALEGMAGGSLTLDRLNVSNVDRVRRAIRFDLEVHFSEIEDGMNGLFIFNSALFEAATIHRMAQHFRTLLEGIVAVPDERLSELPLLTQGERRQVLVEWNQTATAYPRDRCVHELFEMQVEAAPDAEAIICGQQRVNYRALNQRANRWARRLVEAGVRPGSLVTIELERSVELLVGLVAILKAGAGYVPLDRSFPDARLKSMIAQTRAQILLTDTSQADRFQGWCRQVISIGDLDAATYASANLQIPQVSDDVAYVMFTSGSTGMPKGVEIPHKAIARLIWGLEGVVLDARPRIVVLAQTSFDASTFEIWGALLRGGACVIAPPGLPGARELGHLVRRHQVTTMWLTSALFNSVIDELPESLAPVKQLMIGGERLSVSHVKRALEVLPETTLVNGYGPTESTTFACCFCLPRSLEQDSRSIPIGRPIGNTQVYLLDANLNPVPIGVVGELCIGGDGLARGYINQPDLTAEKFVPNPFGDPGTRLYRTGDLARYRADGRIEFLGRCDDQIKIRGYRVELGEIERVLRQQPSLRDAAVVARAHAPSDERLVAYVVPRPGFQPNVEQVREALKTILPPYMIPSSVVMLDELPLSSNGKVNRAVLPRALEEGTSEPCAKPATPSTEIEAMLAAMWRSVLGGPELSISENFFDAGGHSLLGLRLMARIRDEMNVDLPVRELFAHPTIAGLAKQIVAQASKHTLAQGSRQPWRYIFELRPGKGRPVFVFPGGFGGDLEFLVYTRLVYFSGDDYRFYGLRARSADGTQPAQMHVESMVADYLQEICSVQPDGPYLLVGECIGGVVAFEAARQLERAGHTVRALILIDTDYPSSSRYLRYRRKRAVDAFWKRWNFDYYHYRYYHYRSRIAYHYERMRSLDFVGGLRYAVSRSSTAVGLLARGPDSDPAQAIRETYVETLRRYTPKSYNGSVRLILSTESEARGSMSAWSSVVRGNLEAYVVPGDHETYIRDHVKAAAEQLKKCLDG
jgi:amino acid adenylation domain-containing protein